MVIYLYKMKEGKHMKAREILIALHIKHNGNWDKIYEDIRNRNTENIEDYIKDYDEDNLNDFVTIIDEDYPERLKQRFKPPFVI